MELHPKRKKGIGFIWISSLHRFAAKALGFLDGWSELYMVRRMELPPFGALHLDGQWNDRF